MRLQGNRTVFILAALACTALTACGSSDDAGAPDAPAAGPNAQDVETPAGQASEAAQAAGEPAGELQPAVNDADGDPCTLDIQVGDSIAYSTNSLSAPSTCAEVSVTLTHTGKLPAAAMGHNWVLVPEGEAESVAMAGMSAGLEGNFLPSDDDRIIAATRIVGGGESDTATFSTDELAAGTAYVYVCTFPGHWSIMKGTFTVTG